MAATLLRINGSNGIRKESEEAKAVAVRLEMQREKPKLRGALIFRAQHYNKLRDLENLPLPGLLKPTLFYIDSHVRGYLSVLGLEQPSYSSGHQ